MLYVDVILPLSLADYYSYSVPKDLEERVSAGKRVIVSFGKKRLYTALIIEVHNRVPTYDEVKDIMEILDEQPIYSSGHLQFMNWMSSYYLATPGDVYKAALPSGLRPGSETRISYTGKTYDENDFTNDERSFLNLLRLKNEYLLEDLEKSFGRTKIQRMIQLFYELELIQSEESLNTVHKTKEDFVYRLIPSRSEHNIFIEIEQLFKRAPKQLRFFHELLAWFIDHDDCLFISTKELQMLNNYSYAYIAAFIEHGILEKLTEVALALNTSSTLDLTEEQQRAVVKIKEGFAIQKPVLLHGITASGKTAVYFQLIKQCLIEGKEVLFLLPEIALTTQMITRMNAFFGDEVQVYHSKYSEGQRIKVWKKVSENKGSLLVTGARSALFLPFKNLGLIIVDEEHENSYKQMDPAPRYHARDAAIYLAMQNKASIVLGSATPAIESYFNAKNAKYVLVEMVQRYSQVQLPKIVVVQHFAVSKKGEQIVSKPLENEIRAALERGEQIILFQNRRGYAPYVQCDDCKHIVMCKYCNVSMTYHKGSRGLVCHYCGYSHGMPTHCPQCNSENILWKGMGTQKIEEVLNELFPGVRILRLDMDTATSRKSYEHIIQDFAEGRSSILIGTQMVAKGLDFDNVSLVGVLDADALMNYPDFRSYERSFQLMTQVSGRSGRKFKQGKVIIQSMNPKNELLYNVIDHDYGSYYRREINDRKNFFYPPFSRMVRLTFKKKTLDGFWVAVSTFGTIIKKEFMYMYGPQEPVVSRIQNYYLLEILLKIERTPELAERKLRLNSLLNNWKQAEGHKNIFVNIDVDC